jgi:hypothetical protein
LLEKHRQDGVPREKDFGVMLFALSSPNETLLWGEDVEKFLGIGYLELMGAHLQGLKERMALDGSQTPHTETVVRRVASESEPSPGPTPRAKRHARRTTQHAHKHAESEGSEPDREVGDKGEPETSRKGKSKGPRVASTPKESPLVHSSVPNTRVESHGSVATRPTPAKKARKGKEDPGDSIRSKPSVEAESELGAALPAVCPEEWKDQYVGGDLLAFPAEKKGFVLLEGTRNILKDRPQKLGRYDKIFQKDGDAPYVFCRVHPERGTVHANEVSAVAHGAEWWRVSWTMVPVVSRKYMSLVWWSDWQLLEILCSENALNRADGERFVSLLNRRRKLIETAQKREKREAARRAAEAKGKGTPKEKGARGVQPRKGDKDHPGPLVSAPKLPVPGVKVLEELEGSSESESSTASTGTIPNKDDVSDVSDLSSGSDDDLDPPGGSTGRTGSQSPAVGPSGTGVAGQGVQTAPPAEPRGPGFKPTKTSQGPEPPHESLKVTLRVSRDENKRSTTDYVVEKSTPTKSATAAVETRKALSENEAEKLALLERVGEEEREKRERREARRKLEKERREREEVEKQELEEAEKATPLYEARKAAEMEEEGLAREQEEEEEAARLKAVEADRVRKLRADRLERDRVEEETASGRKTSVGPSPTTGAPAPPATSSGGPVQGRGTVSPTNVPDKTATETATATAAVGKAAPGEGDEEDSDTEPLLPEKKVITRGRKKRGEEGKGERRSARGRNPQADVSVSQASTTTTNSNFRERGVVQRVAVSAAAGQDTPMPLSEVGQRLADAIVAGRGSLVEALETDVPLPELYAIADLCGDPSVQIHPPFTK